MSSMPTSLAEWAENSAMAARHAGRWPAEITYTAHLHTQIKREGSFRLSFSLLSLLLPNFTLSMFDYA